MAKALGKRFYKSVSVAPEGAGFVILLDKYRLKTPGKKAADKKTLLLPGQGIADLVAAEWDAQGDKVDPRTMPITRLLNCLLYTSPSPRD